jgi:DNA mismatch repair protein MutL
VGRIQILPAALASQIAAGEVVDRPAGALKELIENSLDAGATRCDVVIEGGGITLLSIRDDGVGMPPDDAVLALERHATSKLRKFDDLSAIRSFGFRGEALPSISSVSRFVLRTRTSDATAGTQVSVDGGAAARIGEVGMAVGTEITVRDLFYNVPARRKFLRSSATEAGHITDVLENAALACPDVTFTLERDGRKAREFLRAPSRRERVVGCLSDEDLATVKGERGPLMVEAYLGRPERARSGAAGLKLFCNNRPIRDRALLMTVAQAFGSVLERGRYPRGVVYLDLLPELVDVNVHPQKTEVRFADARAVADALYQLLNAELRRAFTLPREPFPTPRSRPSDEAPPPLKVSPTLQSFVALRPSHIEELQSSLLAIKDVSPKERPQAEERSSPAPQVPDSAGTFTWSRLRFLAQVRGTYLVCEGDDALVVIDQHAAAERVTFHRLREQYRSESLASQSLLFPVTIEVRPEQTELVEQRRKEIQRLGFELRVHTERTISLHAVPRLLQRASPERLWFDLAAELSRAGRAFSDAIDGMLSTMACHGSIRSGDVVSREEAIALLAELDRVDFSGHCPHGRPIVASTSWAELERRVGRR